MSEKDKLFKILRYAILLFLIVFIVIPFICLFLVRILSHL